MGLFGSQIDPLVETATSEFLPAAQEDLSTNLEICDLIRSKQVASRDAMRAIKRRLQHGNPNLTDACVKNTGVHFLKELASREFVDVLVALCRGEGEAFVNLPTSQNDTLTRKAQSYLQDWALLMSQSGGDGLHYIKEAYEQAKREGIPFPAPKNQLSGLPITAEKLIRTQAPPEWTDSSNCVRCNVTFSMLLRKHHCRYCGKTVCQDCSSKEVALPEFGLYDPVRICETCYAKRLEGKQNTGATPNQPPLSTHSPSRGDSFEDDIAKAIQLSLQESQKASREPIAIKPQTEDEEQAALAAAIEASLKDLGTAAPGTSIPESPSIADPPTQTRPSVSSQIISAVERENVYLFHEFVHKLSVDDDDLEDPNFLILAKDMQNLRTRISQYLAKGDGPKIDLPQLLNLLEEALTRYELLATGQIAEPPSHWDLPHPDISTMPTRPRSHTGSVTRVAIPKPSNFGLLESIPALIPESDQKNSKTVNPAQQQQASPEDEQPLIEL